MKLTTSKHKTLPREERELFNDLVCVTVHLEKSIDILESGNGEVRKRNKIMTKLQSVLSECEDILRDIE